MAEITINQLNPVTLEYQTYSPTDEQLINVSLIDTSFSSSTDYIEYSVYNQNNDSIYPISGTAILSNYTIKKGDILLDPISNLQTIGRDIGTYNILYNFYRKLLSSSDSENYYISEISSDRTEIRLDSNQIDNGDIIISTNEFINYREFGR